MNKTLLPLLAALLFVLTEKTSYAQANAGPDQDICADYTYMNADDPSPNTGQWSVFSGSGTFSDQTLFNTFVTNIGQGMNVYGWEVNSDIDYVSITNNFFTVSAGPNQSICTDNTIMNGDNPLTGNGYWSLMSGSAVIVNSTNRNTVVTDVMNGVNMFSWTITRNGCTNSDNVTISNNSFTISAGSD